MRSREVVQVRSTRERRSPELSQLAALIEGLNLERFTGCVDLGPTGQIWLIDGDVVRASWRGHSGLTALLTLMLMPDTSYNIIDQRPAPGRALVPNLALKGLHNRVSTDWNRLSPMILKASASAPPGPSDQAKAVMALLDGERTLAEAVFTADVPPAAVIEHVATCVDARHLDVVSGPHPMRAPAGWLTNAKNTSDPESDEPDSTAEVMYTPSQPLPRSQWVQEIRNRATAKMAKPEIEEPPPTEVESKRNYAIANTVALVLLVVSVLTLMWLIFGLGG
ncbi:MAG: hypothetical protein ACI9MC_000486 [Kiritimatiellia bacterium]|jgi:hypothetical protein